MLKQLLAACLFLTAAASAAVVAPGPNLLPYPRQVALQGGELRLSGAVGIGVDSGVAEDRFAAGLLQSELASIEHVQATVSQAGHGGILLARADSPAGRRVLAEAGLGFPAAAKAEGYVLVVNSRQAAVVAESAAGIFYGAQTLRQLLRPGAGGGAVAPDVHITDWPALRWRAVEIDLSRGPISKLASIERDIALLAELKINAYVMYFENSFAYASLPLWAPPGGAITAAEAAQIVAFAQSYHVTVIPEQEAFGHVHLGMQAERYQDWNELPYGGLLSPAAPGSLDVIGKMYYELAAAFPGPFFHIGADETTELGTGRSEAMLKEKGAGPLYLDYVKDIDQRLAPYHRKLLFWGDIAVHHPELLTQLPKDMIAVPWVYSPESSYTRDIKPFTDAGVETWVAPGVSNWSRIFPDYAEALPNIENFIRDGRAAGATGVINTNWNDDGESMFAYGWFGYAAGAADSWEDAPERARFEQAYDWALFRADGHAFAQQIENLTDIHRILEGAIHSDGADRLTWHEAFSAEGQALYVRMAPSAHQVRLLAEDVIASMALHRAEARRNRELLDPVEFGARRFDFVGQKAIYAAYIAQIYDAAAAHPENRAAVEDALGRINSINGLLEDMRDGVTELRTQYRELWLEENTPYFLDNILIRYDDELEYWQSESRRFTAISASYSRTHTLPGLVEGAAEGAQR